VRRTLGARSSGVNDEVAAHAQRTHAPVDHDQATACHLAQTILVLSAWISSENLM